MLTPSVPAGSDSARRRARWWPSDQGWSSTGWQALRPRAGQRRTSPRRAREGVPAPAERSPQDREPPAQRAGRRSRAAKYRRILRKISQRGDDVRGPMSRRSRPYHQNRHANQVRGPLAQGRPRAVSLLAGPLGAQLPTRPVAPLGGPCRRFSFLGEHHQARPHDPRLARSVARCLPLRDHQSWGAVRAAETRRSTS